MNEKYKQDQRVYFKLGDERPEGWATIAGVMGWIVILKLEKPLKDYAYTHIYCVDNQIVEPPKEVVEPEE
jgi:hypothetical protein